MNFQLLEYALKSLERERFKNFFIFIVLTFLTALLATMLFITTSMKKELHLTLDGVADIIVSSKVGGMRTPIDESLAFELLEIDGIESALGRVWGYYYFEAAQTNFSLVGVDSFEKQERAFLVDALESLDENEQSMIVGKGVQKVLGMSYYKEYFNFIREDGEIEKVNIQGTFKAATALESNDMIVMSKNKLKKIFGFTQNQVTDIAIRVANKSEVETVALKIQQIYPHLNLQTKEQLRISYENIFNYKSALFLGLYTVAIFTFLIIIYDKLSSMSSLQKREIGILKALGWSIDDVLKAKLYEALVLCLSAYIFGAILALFFVYILNAPYLRDVFIGYEGIKPAFELMFVLDFKVLFLLFFCSVPLYVLASLIPSWRVATLDAAEVMR